MLQTQVQYWQLQENARHNKVTESATFTDLARKENELQAQIEYWKQQVKYWTDTLAETKRHNVKTEGISTKQAQAQLKQAQAALSQASTAEKNLSNLQTQAAASMLNAQTAAAKLPYETSYLSAQADKTGAEGAKTRKDVENYYGINYGIPLLTLAGKLLK